jgi:DNA-binding beta-propeller fold protein YncE
MMVSSAALLSLALLSASGTTASASVPAFVNSIDGHVYIIDTDDGHVIGAIDKNSPMVGYMAASSDGQLVLVGERDAIGVIDTAEQRLIRTIPYDNGTYVIDMIAGPDGRLYVADFRRGCIAVFDARGGSRLDTWQTGEPWNEYISDGDLPVALAISPDGNVLYVASGYSNRDAAVNNNYNVTAYDTKTGKPFSSCRIDRMIYHMISSPDGSCLFVSAAYADGKGECLIPVDTRDLSTGAAIPMPTHTWSMSSSPDGDLLYQASSIAKSVTVVDVPSGSVVKTIPMPGFAASCSVTSDGGKLLVACGNSGLIAVDTSTYAVSTLNGTVTSGPDLKYNSSFNSIIVYGRVIVPRASDQQSASKIPGSSMPASPSPAGTASDPSPAPGGMLDAAIALVSIALLAGALCRKSG